MCLENVKYISSFLSIRSKLVSHYSQIMSSDDTIQLPTQCFHFAGHLVLRLIVSVHFNWSCSSAQLMWLLHVLFLICISFTISMILLLPSVAFVYPSKSFLIYRTWNAYLSFPSHLFCSCDINMRLCSLYYDWSSIAL